MYKKICNKINLHTKLHIPPFHKKIVSWRICLKKHSAPFFCHYSILMINTNIKSWKKPLLLHFFLEIFSYMPVIWTLKVQKLIINRELFKSHFIGCVILPKVLVYIDFFSPDPIISTWIVSPSEIFSHFNLPKSHTCRQIQMIWILNENS